ncbi:FAD:protein FMN transferase [Burkholderiales bacterium]|nr:MAG: FAD:protein FMN transferase [Burkholderiales bacterium]CAG0959158.1 FAD:protein FMN transferase [Burkholderiales bacterium]
MASACEVLLFAPSASEAETAAKSAIEEVQRIERKYSRFRDDSILSAINRRAGHAALPVDGETAALIDFAQTAHTQSDGAFDITSGVLRRAWDFRAKPPRLPSAQEVQALLPWVGWGKVIWKRPRIQLPHPECQLDFGGLAKEYAGDRAAAMLMQRGIRHGLVNLGGDVRAFGGQPDGSPWRVAIAHPRHPDRLLASVALREGALATSGDYERYFEVNGRRYCHLLDPRSGWPVEHLQAASVVAPLAIVAGSLATIAMLRGEAALPLLNSSAESYLLVDREGKVSGTLR